MDGRLSEHAKQDLTPIVHRWCVEHAGWRPPAGRGIQIDLRKDLITSSNFTLAGDCPLITTESSRYSEHLVVEGQVVE